MGRGFWLTAVLAMLAARTANAHDGDHSSMPNMVSLGITPLSVGRYTGSHPRYATPIDDEVVGALGASIAFGRRLGDGFELGLRSEFLKPFPSREALREGLYEFRVVLAPGVVASLVPERLDLAANFQAGIGVAYLNEHEDGGGGTSYALGYTLGAGVSLRAWVTHHTGFSLDAAIVHGRFERGDFELIGVAPLRATLGYHDRF
jgi:hypothetical protein